MKEFARKTIQKTVQHTIARYLIGGTLSACVNLSTLYFFNTVVGLYYLTASIIAFSIAFFVSLFFHKFWTFRERTRGNLRRQGSLYLVSSVSGLGLNTLILYCAVSFLHVHVIIGQIIAGGLVACCTFFISKNFVFRVKTSPSSSTTSTTV